MMSRFVFELKVWQKEESCFFLLLWHEGRRQLLVNLEYKKELQKRYQRWQQRYSRFYKFTSLHQEDGNSSNLDSCSFKPSTGDSAHDLVEAEKELMEEFQRWLGEGEARKIRELIRNELIRVARESSTQGQKAGIEYGIDIFLACDSELERLPWEAWELVPSGTPPGTIRIIRTSMNDLDGAPDRSGSVDRPQQSRKTRILAILGDDPRLPLTEDWKALRSLRSIAEVQRVNWEPEESTCDLKNKVAQAIANDLGWDVLFFAGHSDETKVTGGRVKIAPDVFLSISEIEEQLTQARKNGLQLAIFNSCSGLSIAKSLVNLGLQVVVMREPIRNDVAQSFIGVFCKHLSQREDVLDSLLAVRQYFQSEAFAYPSAHLLPSFFSPSGASPWQPKAGWKQLLQPWLPTRREAVALGIILFLCLLSPVKSSLFHRRAWSQAIYRDRSQEISQALSQAIFPERAKQLPQSDPPPHVLLIAIDQRTLMEEGIDKDNRYPIDRRYLGKLVKKLSSLDARVIGLDYLLEAPDPENDLSLAEPIHAAIKQQKSWFVFASDEHEPGARLSVNERIAKPEWSLPGDIRLTYYPFWEVALPTSLEDEGEVFPFAYALTLAYNLNQETSSVSSPEPRWGSSKNFQLQVLDYLNQTNEPENSKVLPLKQTQPFLGMKPIIDFSIPPSKVYQRLPAYRFLQLPSDADEFQNINERIVIIAPGGYEDADDNYAVPPATYYWHSKEKEDRKWFTGGEAQAYMIHHLLLQNQLLLIPQFWMIGIAVILGKATNILLQRQECHKRKKYTAVLGVATFIYGIVVLQIYISASVSIPWFLPSGMFWIVYILPVLRRKSNA